MRQTDIFKKISRIVQELNEQYVYLYSLDGNYTDLDLELFAAHARFLTDYTEILRKLNDGKAALQPISAELVSALPELVMPQEEILGEPAVADTYKSDTQISEIPAPNNIENSVVTDQEPVPAIQLPEEIPEPQLHTEAAQETEIPVPESVPVPEININLPTDTYSYIRQEPEISSAEHTFNISRDTENVYQEPADLSTSAEPAATAIEIESPVLTLNEKLSAQLPPAEQKAAALHSVVPVTDIKSTINLNDKLLFVKELFNGYSLYYSEAMDLVNRCKNFADAERFLETNYAGKNRWAEKQTTADKFYAALHRRFPQ